MAHDRVIGGDAVRAQDAARRPRAFEGHRHVVHLRHRDVNRLHHARIFHPAELQTEQLGFGDLGQHLDQFLLRQLVPAMGFVNWTRCLA